MIAFFLIVLIIPLIVAAAGFIFFDGINWREFGLIVIAQLIVASSAAGIVSCSNTRDTEVWNGVVTSKKMNPVSCSHSYPCNCRTVCTGSGNNRSCSTTCDTCYEHFWDYDWNVYTSNGEVITISRVDRQGVYEPPRFSQTKMNEPTSVVHSYKNYVKAAPGTLFRHQGLTERYASTLPDYPQHVYDYYRLNRLVPVGVSVEDSDAWNRDLSILNAEQGHAHQVNVIVVLVRDMPQDWYYALEESWIGGKKNDAVLVVGVNNEMRPMWVSVMAWTTDELFKVKLRDEVMTLSKIERGPVIDLIRTNVATHYKRKPMKDFEYLSSQITPTTTEWILTLLVALVVACALMYVFNVHDIFNVERSTMFKFNINARQKSQTRMKTPRRSFLPWYRRLI